jgi:hypothetical protein
MELEPVFVTAIIFGFTYAVIYLFVRKRERLALLEKGVDAKIFLSPRKEQNFSPLKIGLLLIGIAVGLFMGDILYSSGILKIDDVSYFSMIFLFGGLALVISHFIEKNERKALK